jgi:SOS response regulatory protein OraA/RecX
VDDYTFAHGILRQLVDRKDGFYRIKEKMRRRLIPQSVIDKVLKEWKESGVGQDFASIVRETIRKYDRLKAKYQSPKNEYEIRGKLYAFLGQKGYVADEIKEILKRVIGK